MSTYQMPHIWMSLVNNWIDGTFWFKQTQLGLKSMVKTHMNNVKDDKRQWENDKKMGTLMKNDEMVVGNNGGVEKTHWKYQRCQVG
jgi:hypothetical protein